MFIPEFQIANIVSKLVHWMALDYHEQLDKRDSFICKCIGDQAFDGRSLVDESVSILFRGPNDARSIKIHISYPNGLQVVPISIHITSPSSMHTFSPIGNDTADLGHINEDGSISGATISHEKASYGIVVHSDNMVEVILITKLLKKAILSVMSNFGLAGFVNTRVHEKDITLSPESSRMPQPMYGRAVIMEVNHEDEIPLIFTESQFKQILLQGCAVNTENNG